MSRAITPATSLDNLRKEAKRWLRELRANNPDARARFERAIPNAPADPVLRDVQYALAREHGHDSWTSLKQLLDRRRAAGAAPTTLARTAEEYETLAGDLVLAFNTHDEAALQRSNERYQRAFTFDDLWAEVWRRMYSFRQRAFKQPTQDLRVDEARTLIAQDAGFGSWTALMRAVASGAPPVAPYEIDVKENAIGPRRRLTDAEWDELIAVARDRGITTIHAHGMMTDAILAKVARLDRVTGLTLGGSRELTDDGMQHLAGMPQLERLNLSEYPGGRLTDRGLDVLRHLPNCRTSR